MENLIFSLLKPRIAESTNRHYHKRSPINSQNGKGTTVNLKI
jgi:hypothetical protein